MIQFAPRSWSTICLLGSSLVTILFFQNCSKISFTQADLASSLKTNNGELYGGKPTGYFSLKCFMRYLLFLYLAILSGCDTKSPVHLADLPKVEVADSEIQLLGERKKFASTDPLFDLVPPHGGRIEDKIHRLMDSKCYKFPAFKICYENYFMNAGLILSKITNDRNISSLNFKPSAGDFLSRFIGSPPAALYKIVEFSASKVGLQHARRFTLLKDGTFCQSIETNPNHRLSFGVLSKDSKILLFSSGTGTSIDRPVNGWRVFDESRLCK